MDIDFPTSHESTSVSVLVDSNRGPHHEDGMTAPSNPSHLPYFKKRPRPQDDPFFDEGTYEYKASWLRLTEEDAYMPELDLHSSLLLPETENTARPGIHLQRCHLGHCHGEQTFSTTAAYEHHYETNHRHICRSCEKIFPGTKLLDLHLNEVHDIMIKIRREQGQKTYQCFVDGCERLCSTSQKRRQHLIDKHHYPRSFNFSIVFTGVIPMAQRIKEAAKEKALWASRVQGKQKASSGQHQLSNSTSLDMDVDLLTNPASGAGAKSTVSIPSTRKGQSANSTTASALLDSGNAHRSSAATQGDRTRSTPSKVDSSQPPARKLAFQQYRAPAATTPANHPGQSRRRSSADRRPSMDMEYTHNSTGGGGPLETTSNAAPASIPYVSASRPEDTFAMDMDQLQQSMTRLMIPRQVANKIKRPQQRQ
ncbi:hypothetical protein EMPS_10842 [Entomortierella parvispora]|uniref:C2H2-type domain-containing protein n=1 Tax=Entomortierella parvispora TaxID=205924 RepID=A0A9P3HLD3_9FUNG|nr:hypothetical protein EMPS_10842 [Entomortierella parvispora]